LKRRPIAGAVPLGARLSLGDVTPLAHLATSTAHRVIAPLAPPAASGEALAMAKKPPVTPAIRALRAAGVPFTPHLYDYVERGGARASAAALGVPLHQVLKTLVFEDEAGAPLIIVTHGDQEVAPGRLAKLAGVKRLRPCDPAVAERHTGYKVGGTSPFGTRKALPIWLAQSVRALETVYLNGGKRGFLVELQVADLLRTLQPKLAEDISAPRGP